MSITVGNLSRAIDSAGVDKNQLGQKVGEAKNGQLAWHENLAAKAKLGGDSEVKRTAANADKLIKEDFGGNAAAARDFLKKAEGTPLDKQDFNTFVESGQAHQYIMASREASKPKSETPKQEAPKAPSLTQTAGNTPTAPTKPVTPTVSKPETPGASAPNTSSIQTTQNNTPTTNNASINDGPSVGIGETGATPGGQNEQMQAALTQLLSSIQNFAMAGGIISMANSAIPMFQQLAEGLGVHMPNITQYNATGQAMEQAQTLADNGLNAAQNPTYYKIETPGPGMGA